LIHLPTAGVDIPWLLVVLMSLLIGAIAGFFGVGGGFLSTPLLNALFGVPYGVAVGSSLSQMIGLSVAATLRHSRLGNIDYRLGGGVLIGSAIGAEAGALTLEALKGLGSVRIGAANVPVITLAMSLAYVVLLTLVGMSILREAVRTARERDGDDHEAHNSLIVRLQGIRLAPMLPLPASGIPRVSLWVLMAVGVFVGYLSGLLGVGGGFVLMPVLIYAIGCPTVMAIGTGMFQTLFTAAFSTYTHSLRGNVDLLLVLLMLVGSTVGAHIGAGLTRLFDASRVRGGFAILCFVGVLVVAVKLVSTLVG